MDFRRCQESITVSRLWLGRARSWPEGINSPVSSARLPLGTRELQQNMPDKLESIDSEFYLDPSVGKECRRAEVGHLRRHR